MTSSQLQRILEIYRGSQYRTTTSGRKVRWDKPGESDTPEVRHHNAYLNQKHQQKKDAQDRLKKKGAVPTKNGKPIIAGNLVLTETIQQVLMSFRRHYQSTRPMRFRDWIKTVAELLDDLG